MACNSEITRSSKNHNETNCDKFSEQDMGISSSNYNIITSPIIHLSKCVLYAPNPCSPPPTMHKKPLGCKMVVVGGLPENATEIMMKEIFEMSGEIATIKTSVNNFCHITFSNESYVDQAIYFSGYRIKIDNKDDAPNNGCLYVDYAQARDDQFECYSRHCALRHQTQKESHSPSVTPYSDHEAVSLSTKLRKDETFQSAVQVLISWLEHGECTKRNAGYFYSMIQSTNSHIHRLRNKELRYENELNEAQIKLEQKMNNILIQLGDIGEVFTDASLQKVWDHFTEAQRKNITVWKNDVADICNVHMQGISSADEMDLSKDDSSVKSESDDDQSKKISQEELDRLREENNSLRRQLDASQKEVLLVRAKFEEEKKETGKEMQMICQNMENTITNTVSLPVGQSKAMIDRTLINSKENALNWVLSQTRSSLISNSCDNNYEDDNCSANNIVTSTSDDSFEIYQSEARFIGLISAFLTVHPFGASIDYIYSYLHEINPSVHVRDIETLMNRYPTVFKEISSGIGASLVKKWTFCVFKRDSYDD